MKIYRTVGELIQDLWNHRIEDGEDMIFIEKRLRYDDEVELMESIVARNFTSWTLRQEYSPLYPVSVPGEVIRIWEGIPVVAGAWRGLSLRMHITCTPYSIKPRNVRNAALKVLLDGYEDRAVDIADGDAGKALALLGVHHVMWSGRQGLSRLLDHYPTLPRLSIMVPELAQIMELKGSPVRRISIRCGQTETLQLLRTVIKYCPNIQELGLNFACFFVDNPEQYNISPEAAESMEQLRREATGLRGLYHFVHPSIPELELSDRLLQ